MGSLSTQAWATIAFVAMVLFIVGFMLIVPQFLGGKSWARAKHQPFESGIVSVGGARLRLSAKFYLVAIFFVLFDIEALFLYAWATSVKEVGWLGFAEVLIFVVVLLAGLIYVIRVGAMNWSPSDKGVHPKQPKTGGLQSKAIALADVTDFIPFEELAKDRLGKIPAQLSGEIAQSAESNTRT